MKLLTVCLLLVTLLAAKEHKQEHREHFFPMDMGYLDLSEQQHKAVKKIIKAFRDQYKELHHQEREKDEKVSELFLAEVFNIEAFIELNAHLKQDAIEIQANFFSRIHKLLTPKQKERFIRYMREWDVE